MKVLSAFLLCGAFTAGLSHGAAADCDGRIKSLQSQVETISDGRTKQLVEFDISRAQRESGEADEEECGEALDHADKLLKSAH